jgi:hypothetical protein
MDIAVTPVLKVTTVTKKYAGSSWIANTAIYKSVSFRFY